MPRIRGKKSSNEPSNASEEEAPNAGEQQPAELQPDTTDIRDTQQQLQSHMNQLQTDMTGMKSDMATIMSLLQSLTNNGALPGHQATQTTTTAQQPHAETETRLKQNIPVEANESESDNQPDETRPSNKGIHDRGSHTEERQRVQQYHTARSGKSNQQRTGLPGENNQIHRRVSGHQPGTKESTESDRRDCLPSATGSTTRTKNQTCQPHGNSTARSQGCQYSARKRPRKAQASTDGTDTEMLEAQRKRVHIH